VATFTHGSNADVLVNGYDLSSYLREASVSPSADVAETTAFADTAKTYIAGLKDAAFSASGMLDSAAAAVGSVAWTALGVNNSEISYYPSGDSAGGFGYGLDAQETSVEIVSPVDGVNAISLEAQSSSGAERLVSLAALTSRSGTANLTGIQDAGAATTSNGYAAYLHMTVTPTAGTATIKVQHSDDDSTYVDLCTFTDVATLAAVTSERSAASGTVRQYARVQHTISAGGACTFQVGLSRKPNL
jgi:hypothetical protein